MDFRPVLYVIGALLTVLALGMTVPMFVDMAAHQEDWKVFLICIATTAFFGGCLVLANAGSTGFEISIRQAFLLTSLGWLAMATFGALPIWLSHESISFTDAFFESMSGITTTGSTIMTNLEGMPPGTLLWRAILNWLGGMGFILMAILILPFLKVGGMQLFRMESSDKSDKPMPRLQRIGVLTGVAYVVLTTVCALCYWVAGMSGFDAINHSMSTIATGGLSTHDASFGFYDSNTILLVGIVFMTLGSLPFILYVRAMNGDIISLFKNAQVRALLLALAAFTLIVAGWLVAKGILAPLEAFIHAAFNITSVVSTTGFSSMDYMQWGSLPIAMFFVITFIGGCTGSTSGGIKMMRFQIMGQVLIRHIKKLAHPTAVIPLRYDDRVIGDDIAYSVMVFTFTFLLCFAVISIGLGLCGLDLVTSISGAAATLTNVGPGLGPIIGPAGNFSSLPDSAKWIMSLAMLLGRLEMFTVLVLFTPYFWRR